MIDLDSAYNHAVIAQQTYLANLETQRQANILKHQQWLEGRQVLQNTFNSIIAENIDNVKSFLSDKYAVTRGEYNFKLGNDDVIYTYNNLVIKPSDNALYYSNFTYYKVKDLSWTTTDDLIIQINKLLGEFIIEIKLYGVRDCFGRYLKL